MKITREENAVVFFLEGKIDTTNAAEWEKQLFAAVHEHGDAEIVLDCEGLTYISSAGLRVLTKLKKSLDYTPTMRGVSPEIFTILEMTGLSALFHVVIKIDQFSLDGCEVIGQGTFRTVYRYAPDTIVKVYNGPDSLNVIEEEQQRARYAFLKGIPTAIPYAGVVQVGDLYGSIYELIDARTFSAWFRDHPENEENLLRIYADLLRQIHSIEADRSFLPDARQTFLQFLEELGGVLPQETEARLKALFKAMPEDLHLVHGDIQMQNVMCRQDEPMLIDMDTLCVGDPVFDFAALQVTYEAFPEDEPDNGMKFAGIPNERYRTVWRRTLKYYLDGADAATLERAADKIRVIGCVRFLYLVAVLNVGEPSLRERRIRHALEHLENLLPRVNSLRLFEGKAAAQPAAAPCSELPLRVSCPAELPPHVTQLAKLFADAGHEIYLAGGCVRDMLLGRDPNDYDFATSATTDEIQELCRENHLDYDAGYLFLDDVPVSFGEGETFDVSRYHGESLEEDMRRRDLSINALAYDVLAGEIVDWTGGLEDLRNGIIRLSCPITPDKSGNILRALRFSLELGFRIEPESYRSLQAAVPYLENIRSSTLIHGMTKLLEHGKRAFTDE
ncbi:MAG: anti-sigma factor antagonist [Candidatus Limivicinus sp.]